MFHLPGPHLPLTPQMGIVRTLSLVPLIQGHISLCKMPMPLGCPLSPKPLVVIFWNPCSAMHKMSYILKFLYELSFTFSPKWKPGDAASPAASSGGVALSLTSPCIGLGGGAGVLLHSHHHCQTLLRPTSGSGSSVTPRLIPSSHPLPPAPGHSLHFSSAPLSSS